MFVCICVYVYLCMCTRAIFGSWAFREASVVCVSCHIRAPIVVRVSIRTRGSTARLEATLNNHMATLNEPVVLLLRLSIREFWDDGKHARHVDGLRTRVRAKEGAKGDTRQTRRRGGFRKKISFVCCASLFYVLFVLAISMRCVFGGCVRLP